MNISTPYYLIDEKKLLQNLKTIQYVKENSGAKVVLALKCFSTWAAFPLIKQYLDGTTSSSLYEMRLGHEKFSKETHAYCVAFSPDEIKKIPQYADKVIFNSISQLKAFHSKVSSLKIGLRINPKISYSHFDLANPARKYSRLGVTDKKAINSITNLISGAMFHFNCENDDFKNFSTNLDFIETNYSGLLKKLDWISLGGGIFFTKYGYPIDKFCKRLKNLSSRFKIQIYLEPGEAVITQAGTLVTKILDIVHNEIDIAIVDASVEAHMLDLLIYRLNAKIEQSYKNGKFKYIIAGRSCLAGDIFGTFNFNKKLKIGDTLKITDAAGYTMVKKNWFNGITMPAIVIKKLNGTLDLIRNFDYNDFKKSLS